MGNILHVHMKEEGISWQKAYAEVSPLAMKGTDAPLMHALSTNNFQDPCLQHWQYNAVYSIHVQVCIYHTHNVHLLVGQHFIIQVFSLHDFPICMGLRTQAYP